MQRSVGSRYDRKDELQPARRRGRIRATTAQRVGRGRRSVAGPDGRQGGGTRDPAPGDGRVRPVSGGESGRGAGRDHRGVERPVVAGGWPVLRRGEIRDYVVGSRQLRVLIVSSDDYTGASMQRWGLVVTPRRADTRAAGRLLVTLGPGDPQHGQVVHIPLVLRI